MANVKATTGLPKNNGQRYHFDIYAILEGPQEIYLGHEVAVNVNLVETVKIATPQGEIEKCYLSPTKRRGIERRMLIWAPLADGSLLGDKLGCGIPHTCARDDCPICLVYGALLTKDSPRQLGEFGELADPKEQGKKLKDRPPRTLIGRVTHGGGVAVQEQDPSEKQRALHPSILARETRGDETKPTPMPFKREYDEPGLLYPVYNHALSVSDEEFCAVAYAFLQSIARLGAGNPKGMKIYEGEILGKVEPMLVVDRYLTPLGNRPVVSPLITGIPQAIEQFSRAARTVYGQERDTTQITEGDFQRWLGSAALVKLQEWSQQFVNTTLKAG